MALVLVIIATLFLSPNTTFAIAKASTLSMQISTDFLGVTIVPSASGSFGKTSNATISVHTDNFTGYTLEVAATASTNLVNDNDDNYTIPSITSSITESAFSSNSSYNNKWGFKPSSLVVSNNNVNSTVSNTDFISVPSISGTTMDVTSGANSVVNNEFVDNTYTVAFGARVDSTLPAGTYTYTYVIRAVANTITYNVAYDDNTSETVTNMPSPNPDVLEVDGGTPTAQSYAALSDAVPSMTSGDLVFGGWCTVATAINPTTGNYQCSGTIYQAGDNYPIDQTSGATNITLYAIWQTDPFPTVWSQTGKCIFNNGTISGSECRDYANDNYIDTGIALYSNDNYLLDYEVHFVIDAYVPNNQSDSQSTIFNDKLSEAVTESPYGGRSPGIIVRRNGGKPLEIKSTYGAPNDNYMIRYVDKSPTATAYSGTDIRIFRINGIIYTSIDNGPLVFLHDYTTFNQQFGLSAWFGAYPDSSVNCTENCTASMRYFTGELSNMYIKLGDMPTDNLFDITFNANGGTPSTTVYKIISGNALGELPTATRSGWLFDGWYTGQNNGQNITTETVPTVNNTTYWAHWKLSVADAQITNTDVHLSTSDTETINITNGSDIESYTLVSSDSSVATVDSSGVITAVGNGTATITLTGTLSGDTRTITVTVGTLFNVNFDSQGGTPTSYTWSVAENGSFSSLPEPTKPGYTLDGWYTGLDGTGTEITTSTVFTVNTPTQYYANWEEATYVCKIATTLHEETCNQTGSNGCKGTSFPNNTITYGTLVSSSNMTAGDAYNCDINYDGLFDETTERFYYFGTENGNAKFVYYKSLQDTSAVYDVSLALLPTSSDPGWDNPNLVTFSGDYNGSVARFMTYPEALALCDNATSGLGIDGRCLYLLEKSAFANTNITDGVWLERQPSYANRIHTRSRSLTHGSTTENAPRPTIEVPTQYVEPYTEPMTAYEITFNPHNGSNNFTREIVVSNALDNDYPSPDPTYTDHIFQGWYTAVSGGTLVTDQTIPDGNWTYHAQWIGTVALAQVASNSITVIEGNTTTVSVTNASDLEAFTFSSSDTSVVTVDPSTGVVTAVGQGTATISITGADSHTTNQIVTITSVDPSTTFRVTFDPQNGDSTFYADVLVGNSIGANMPQNNPTYANHVFQRWYDISNNNTVTSATEVYSAMTVYAEWKLDVTQAVISNSDLTMLVGEGITISVSNSAQLEAYTFSSSDTSIATVDANTGAVTGVNVGTTNIIMTGAQSNLTKTIEIEVTPPPAPKYTVTFDANGGSTPTPAASYQIEEGDQVGSLPTTSRANYRFFGWYKDNGTFYEEVYPEETIEADVIFYARWIEDTASFPIVFAEINECQFNGSSVISGTYCTQDTTKNYVNSGVALFSTANYQKDFEIGFTITEYDPDAQSESQATLVNSKHEDQGTNYPGFVMRRTGNKFQLTGRFSHGNPTDWNPVASTTKRVKIVRQNGVLKYSVNDGNLTTWYDVTNNTHRFDTNVWFGASAQADGTTSQRYLVGKLTDMYVKLENTSNSAANSNSIVNSSSVVNSNLEDNSVTGSSDNTSVKKSLNGQDSPLGVFLDDDVVESYSPDGTELAVAAAAVVAAGITAYAVSKLEDDKEEQE